MRNIKPGAPNKAERRDKKERIKEKSASANLAIPPKTTAQKDTPRS
jgi:hypothetical protein